MIKNKLPEINGRIIKISVIGGAKCGKAVYDDAYKIGYCIAKNNAILVCGGLSGVMEACAHGAKDAGGITIGILPAEYESLANKYIDIKIPTGIGYARNVIVVKSGHAVIAIDGGFGTLSEIGYTLSYGKPLIAYQTWTLIPCASEYEPEIHIAKTPEEAVKKAIEHALYYVKNAVL
jgi:hypothetical protein